MVLALDMIRIDRNAFSRALKPKRKFAVGKLKENYAQELFEASKKKAL